MDANFAVVGGEVTSGNVWRCSADHIREPPNSRWTLFKPRHLSIFHFLELRIILRGVFSLSFIESYLKMHSVCRTVVFFLRVKYLSGGLSL